MPIPHTGDTLEAGALLPSLQSFTPARARPMFRLLICDDHPPIRTALRLLAKEAAPGACEVTESASAEELMALLHAGRPYDFLTLDLQLPGRSGPTVNSVTGTSSSARPNSACTASASKPIIGVEPRPSDRAA